MPRLPEWPRLNPSELRHNIQIQLQSTGQDEFGQPLQAWNTILTAWASIEELTEAEQYQAGQFTSQVTHTITLRWPSVAITGGMRVLHGSQVYLIQTPVNVQKRNIVLKLRALEINGAE